MEIPARFWTGDTAPIPSPEASDRDRRLAEAFVDMESTLGDLKAIARTLERFSELTIERDDYGARLERDDQEILVTLITQTRAATDRMAEEWRRLFET
ncbi:hypothetical protein VQ045_19890 [Aurantimonas sp. E1-2-R+4]|uniref:hypothetical protein n=1 Tax=Aurantimonas sp. E1-2-R+4 TaxID=3113714 RepID=UPI002F9317A0